MMMMNILYDDLLSIFTDSRLDTTKLARSLACFVMSKNKLVKISTVFPEKIGLQCDIVYVILFFQLRFVLAIKFLNDSSLNTLSVLCPFKTLPLVARAPNLAPTLSLAVGASK